MLEVRARNAREGTPLCRCPGGGALRAHRCRPHEVLAGSAPVGQWQCSAARGGRSARPTAPRLWGDRQQRPRGV